MPGWASCPSPTTRSSITSSPGASPSGMVTSGLVASLIRRTLAATVDAAEVLPARGERSDVGALGHGHRLLEVIGPRGDGADERATTGVVEVSAGAHRIAARRSQKADRQLTCEHHRFDADH